MVAVVAVAGGVVVAVVVTGGTPIGDIAVVVSGGIAVSVVGTPSPGTSMIVAVCGGFTGAVRSAIVSVSATSIPCRASSSLPNGSPPRTSQAITTRPTTTSGTIHHFPADCCGRAAGAAAPAREGCGGTPRGVVCPGRVPVRGGVAGGGGGTAAEAVGGTRTGVGRSGGLPVSTIVSSSGGAVATGLPQRGQNRASAASAAPQYVQKLMRERFAKSVPLQADSTVTASPAAIPPLEYDAPVMNDAAVEYVNLVLAMGEHDADHVDAYYGPPHLREQIRTSKPSLRDIHARAIELRSRLASFDRPAQPIEALRLDYLRRQTDALLARNEILEGRQMSFDEESKALYDAVAPTHPEEYFQKLNAEIAGELPGSGTLAERVEAFRRRFVIPREKLDAVFGAAIDVCRAKTAAHMALPPGESFRVEYVNDKAWSGYNWYQGNFASLIQVNTDLPIFIDRAIDLACHEGYPGHHVYNSLLEKSLVRDRGWIEFSVYALFSAQSLIAEGSANYGIEVAFPADERVEMEQETLFPIAGLDPSAAARYYRIHELVARTGYAGNEAARRYLDGAFTAEQAAEWLTSYALMEPARARQRVKFFDQYRSYVINYNLGKDLVRDFVERRCGGDVQRRWEIFAELLSSPRLPSGLA
jgi:hypothetical protein